MLWWIVPVGVFMLVISYLLFTPFFIGIDSAAGYAEIRFGRLAEFGLVLNETEQTGRLRIAWWKKSFDLFVPPRQAAIRKTEKPAVKAKKRGAMPLDRLLRKVRALLSSFRITKCFITVDTGDMRVNGILYPWVYLLKRRTGKDVSINFWGENVIILEAKNTIARMLWAYVKS